MARTSFTVTELNAHIKQLLDADALLGNVCVTGELSNYKVYPSGHHYFTLKDAESSLRCVMFRSSAQSLRFRPASGMSVAAIGRITAAAAGVLAQDAFAPARANLVDDFLAHIGEHLTTQPSDALALAETGTLTVTVESAEPLSAAALDALTGTLTRAYGHVTVMTTVRPELIGGVCLRIGDTHYDGTLRHALDLLEQDAANSVLHTTQKTPDLADCIRAKLADTHVGIEVFQSGVYIN